MVFSRRSLRRMEVLRFPVVDPWETYVVQPFPVPLSNVSLIVFIAGSGKSVLWCAVSYVFSVWIT